MAKPASDTYAPAETKQRFDAILRGAMHKPTPLKDIPKKDGKSRSLVSGKPKPSRKRDK